MSTSDIIALIALTLNLITLIIVIYQTNLTRKSVNIANESIDRDRKVRQLEMLPRANFIIHVGLRIDQWLDEIEQVREDLSLACKDENAIALREIAKRGLHSPKGLVDSSFYEKSPDWLAEIYMSAARFYYPCIGPLYELWDEEINKANFFICKSIIERCAETEVHLLKLRSYLINLIPDSYLEAPASLPDRSYLSD
ncbi:hypothetical protein [Lutispora sp.]|uniref:hypothetical protein n=1 Tax=Lutispora sp. TaxID=2828727 RepID=UPI003566D76F